jgi:hypothetical protein
MLLPISYPNRQLWVSVHGEEVEEEGAPEEEEDPKPSDVTVCTNKWKVQWKQTSKRCIGIPYHNYHFNKTKIGSPIWLPEDV